MKKVDWKIGEETVLTAWQDQGQLACEKALATTLILGVS